MGILLDRLSEKRILVSDGAWGTMLQAQGLAAGDCPEEWNLSHAAQVQAVAQAYAEAGADLVLTNTFGGSGFKLAKTGYGDQVNAFNAAGAKNSLLGAGDAIVAGSVGPTGEFLEPYGDVTGEQMESCFAEQIGAMLEAGLRVLCVETMSAVEEAACAIGAAKKLDPSVEVICTMTFDNTAKGFRTMMGTGPGEAASRLADAGADVVGSNCGNGIEQMVAIARQMREATSRPILVHANAGLPQRVDGKTVFTQTPDDFAARVGELVEAGAVIIGGCCGTTPDHIRAIRAAVDAIRGGA